MTRKTMTFLAVGGTAYVVDVGAFNWLRGTATFGAADPAVARTMALVLAMAVTYLGNRWLTWSTRRGADRRREVALFVSFNLTGLVLSLIPLYVSHDVLGLTSPLADNISANGVGLVLGTLFRYWAYETFVFRSA